MKKGLSSRNESARKRINRDQKHRSSSGSTVGSSPQIQSPSFNEFSESLDKGSNIAQDAFSIKQKKQQELLLEKMVSRRLLQLETKPSIKNEAKLAAMAIAETISKDIVNKNNSGSAGRSSSKSFYESYNPIADSMHSNTAASFLIIDSDSVILEESNDESSTFQNKNGDFSTSATENPSHRKIKSGNHNPRASFKPPNIYQFPPFEINQDRSFDKYNKDDGENISVSSSVNSFDGSKRGEDSSSSKKINRPHHVLGLKRRTSSQHKKGEEQNQLNNQSSSLSPLQVLPGGASAPNASFLHLNQQRQEQQQEQQQRRLRKQEEQQQDQQQQEHEGQQQQLKQQEERQQQLQQPKIQQQEQPQKLPLQQQRQTKEMLRKRSFGNTSQSRSVSFLDDESEDEKLTGTMISAPLDPQQQLQGKNKKTIHKHSKIDNNNKKLGKNDIKMENTKNKKTGKVNQLNIIQKMKMKKKMLKKGMQSLSNEISHDVWMCGVCGKTFASLETAERHEDQHIWDVINNLGWGQPSSGGGLMMEHGAAVVNHYGSSHFDTINTNNIAIANSNNNDGYDINNNNAAQALLNDYAFATPSRARVPPPDGTNGISTINIKPSNTNEHRFLSPDSSYRSLSFMTRSAAPAPAPTTLNREQTAYFDSINNYSNSNMNGTGNARNDNNDDYEPFKDNGRDDLLGSTKTRRLSSFAIANFEPTRQESTLQDHSDSVSMFQSARRLSASDHSLNNKVPSAQINGSGNQTLSTASMNVSRNDDSNDIYNGLTDRDRNKTLPAPNDNGSFVRRRKFSSERRSSRRLSGDASSSSINFMDSLPEGAIVASARSRQEMHGNHFLSDNHTLDYNGLVNNDNYYNSGYHNNNYPVAGRGNSATSGGGIKINTDYWDDFDPTGEALLLPNAFKDAIVLADEALVNVCAKATPLILTSCEIEAERELALLASDKVFYDTIVERKIIRNRGDQAYNKYRWEGKSVLSKLQNKFVDAYQIMKEGDPNSGGGLYNDEYLKRKKKRGAGIEKDGDGDHAFIVHSGQTLYVNVMVRNSIQVVNHELERLAKARWEDTIGVASSTQAASPTASSSAANAGETTRFERFRALAHGNLVKLAGLALASDFTPRRIAVQLSNDLYRLLKPRMKRRGVTIETEIEYRVGPYFVLSVNIRSIDWGKLLKVTYKEVVARNSRWIEQIHRRKEQEAEEKKGKDKRKAKEEGRGRPDDDKAKEKGQPKEQKETQTSKFFRWTEVFAASLRMTRFDVVAQLLALLYHTHWVIYFPICVIFYYCFFGQTIRSFIISTVIDEIFYYVEQKGMEMEIELQQASTQAAFMLAALRELRAEDMELKKKKQDAEMEKGTILGPLLGPAIKQDKGAAPPKPPGFIMPENLEFIGLELDLPVGYRRLRWALLCSESEFAKEAVFRTEAKYDQITFGPWSKHDDYIGKIMPLPDGLTEEDFVGAEKVGSYMMPKSAFVAANMCYETTYIEAYNDYVFCVKKRTLSPDVPYGATFVAWTQYIVINTGNETCRLICSVEAEFPNGPPLVSRQIKSGMRAGTAELFVLIGETISKYADEYP